MQRELASVLPHRDPSRSMQVSQKKGGCTLSQRDGSWALPTPISRGQATYSECGDFRLVSRLGDPCLNHGTSVARI